MKTRCPLCRTKINKGDRYCDNCYKTKIKANKETQKRKVKEADDKLKTSLWKATREHIIQRDNYCCRLCLINNYVETRGLQVHHIYKRVDRPELTFSEGNLVTVCRVCHEKIEKLSPKEQLNLLKLDEIIELDFSL